MIRLRFLYFTFLLSVVPLESAETFRVMSFNVLTEDRCDHNQPNCWENRKGKVISIFRFHHIDLAGLQEPLLNQVEDLQTALQDFDTYSIGLEDGKELGLHNAILFRKSRFQREDAGFFYLSPTPDRPSKGWDGKYIRGVSWVRLLDKTTGRPFYFFNTHFEYHSQWARNESALLLLEKIASIAGSDPVILTGDFNLFPNKGGRDTFQLLAGENSPIHDAQTASLFPHHGPTGTWSGFKRAGRPGIKPDYVFVGGSIEVYLHGVLSDTFDGKFPSDHLPVVADVWIE